MVLAVLEPECPRSLKIREVGMLAGFLLHPQRKASIALDYIEKFAWLDESEA